MSEQENVNIVQQMDTDFRQGNVPGEQKVELSRLGAFEWFAGLNEEDLAEISLACEECTVQPGTIIIRQGQVGNEVYLTRISVLASWPPAILHPTASIGAVSLVFPSRATPAAQEGANSAPPGT